MTQEQKAKAYDEALKRAKSWAKGEHPEYFSEAQKAAEFIFPELKEDKDERIKSLIIGCAYAADITPEGREEIFAWLEKQQKPIIFIPKFRVGDKLVSTKNPRLTYEVLEVGHINELGNPEYKVKIFTDGKVRNPHNIYYMECCKVDEWAALIEQKPVWSEEDEKIRKEIIRILKGETSYTSKEDTDKYVAWLEKQGFKASETSIKDAEEEVRQYLSGSGNEKYIAEFMERYANWNRQREEWDRSLLEALIQRGKPY